MVNHHDYTGKIVLVTTLVIIAVMVLGFSGQSVVDKSVTASPDTSASTTFKVGWFGTNIDTLNPFLSYSQLTGWINSNIYLPLVDYNTANHTVQPALASSWQINFSNHTAIFNINPNAVWSDGQPVTSQDVVYTYNIAAQNYTFVHSYVSAISNVTALNSHQVMITFSGVLWEMFASTIYIVPQHIWKNINPTSYAGYNPNGTGNTYFVGDGPFVLTNYSVTNNYVIIQKNSKFFIPSKEPKLTEVVFQFFSSQSSAVSALQSNEIQGLSGILPANVAQFQNNSAFQVTTSPALEYLYLSINVDNHGSGNPTLRNATVRQAMAHALNLTYLIQTVFHGYASTISSVLAPTNSYYDHNLTNYAYNVTLAKQMLNQAGFSTIVNGVRENSTGAKLSYTMLVPSSNQEAVNLAQLIAQNLSTVDIKVTVQAESTGSMSSTIWLPNGTLGQDMDLWDWFDNIQQAPQLLSVFLSGQVVTGTSDSGFNNTSYDALWNELLNASSVSQAKDIANQMQAILHEQLPYIPLVAPSSINVWSSSYTNISSAFPGGPFGGNDYMTFITATPSGTAAPSTTNYIIYGVVAAIVVIIGVTVGLRMRDRDR